MTYFPEWLGVAGLLVGLVQLSLAALLAIGDLTPSRWAGQSPIGQMLLGIGALVLGCLILAGDSLPAPFALLGPVAFLSAFLIGLRAERKARFAIQAARPRAVTTE